MNLKLLVNDKYLYDDFLEYLDGRISMHRKIMEQSDDEVELFRAQGAIMALNKLKQLREEVNG